MEYVFVLYTRNVSSMSFFFSFFEVRKYQERNIFFPLSLKMDSHNSIIF